jgi:hypothetical protein
MEIDSVSIWQQAQDEGGGLWVEINSRDGRTDGFEFEGIEGQLLLERVARLCFEAQSLKRDGLHVVKKAAE